MKKPKSGKKTTLSKKLLLSLLGAIVLSVMSVNFIAHLLSFLVGDAVIANSMYLGQLAMLVLMIVLFSRIVDLTILRGVQELNEAVAQVAAGNYEITLPVKGHDELSGLTENFNQMARELKANAFLSKDFARYVSREFKTPLAVIRNYAELTQAESVQPETAQNMEIIISEADRLTGLSKDILELCRLDSTTIIEKKDRFSPAAQIRSILLDLQLLWGEKNIEIIPELAEFEIIGNEALLFRVWQNILGNAIKFTGQNGQISVTLKRDSNGFTCKVADNGIGIDDAEKDHIFTPFYSGSRFRNKEGSGLGLSLSKKIVEKLGGTITFESEAGKQTTFTITIPF